MEVAPSSASHDLHDKLNVYRRNGVREYLIWRILDERIDGFDLVDDEYRSLLAGGGTKVASSRPAPCGPIHTMSSRRRPG